jgi:hypothetical protein
MSRYSSDSPDAATPFFRDGDRPSDPKAKRLIAQVANQLKVTAGRREECEVAIRVQLQAAKSSSEFNKKIPHAGEITTNAEIVYSSLRKARTALKTIGAPFEAVFEDETNYDDNKRHNDFLSLLDVAIRTAERLSQDIIIPKGKKPRDIDKYFAKTSAAYLVGQFCDLGDTIGGLSLSTKRLQNSVAKSFYEYLTGNQKVDLSGRAADFAPERLTLKVTRGPTRRK